MKDLPAIPAAAQALRFGWDPLVLLDLAGVEFRVAKRVLQEAVDQQAKWEKEFWQNLQNAVQNGVAKAFGA